MAALSEKKMCVLVKQTQKTDQTEKTKKTQARNT